MKDEIKEIREYISCPQFGDDHYGKWGALRLDQRIKIKDLLDYITNLQEENKRLLKKSYSDDVIITKAIEHIDLYINRLLNNDIAITPIEMRYLKDILEGDKDD